MLDGRDGTRKLTDLKNETFFKPIFYMSCCFLTTPSNLLFGENWAVRKTGYSQELYICWQTRSWQLCLGENTRGKSPLSKSGAAVTLLLLVALAQFSLFTLKEEKLSPLLMDAMHWGSCVCFLVQRMVAAAASSMKSLFVLCWNVLAGSKTWLE